MARIDHILLIVLANSIAIQAAPVRDPGQWVTLKGKIVWDEPKDDMPKQIPLVAQRDTDAAAMDNEFLSEEWVVNPKNGGFKNIIIWLAPEPTDAQAADLKAGRLKIIPPFAATDIHPQLVKPAKDTVEIEQYCCRFIPHALGMRAGQKLVIKNTATVPHNAKCECQVNESVNVLIMPGKAFTLPKPLVAEKIPIYISCSIHPWMKTFVRVFDHPYYAVTDSNGNFEIKDAPVLKGKIRLWMWHHEAGYSGGRKGMHGQTVEVKPGEVSLGAIKFDVPN